MECKSIVEAHAERRLQVPEVSREREDGTLGMEPTSWISRWLDSPFRLLNSKFGMAGFSVPPASVSFRLAGSLELGNPALLPSG